MCLPFRPEEKEEESDSWEGSVFIEDRGGIPQEGQALGFKVWFLTK